MRAVLLKQACQPWWKNLRALMSKKPVLFML
jgi:hypothetical protein